MSQSATDSTPLAPADTAPPAVVAATCAGLTADDLLAVLHALFAGGGRCCHLRARPDALPPLGEGLPASVAGWTEGRVWDAQVEVRWRETAPGAFEALFLAEGRPHPPGFTPLPLALRAVAPDEPAGLYLWGERDLTGRYFADRLGRALTYPAALSIGPRPRLPCRLLVDGSGAVRFVRLTLPEAS
jgi:hypothetical protein